MRRSVTPRAKLYYNAAIMLAALAVVVIGATRAKTHFVVAWIIMASVGMALAAYNCILAMRTIRD